MNFAEFVNAGDDLALFLVFLLDALKGRSPYTILMVNGEEGSAKSKLTEFARAIIDPALVAKHTSLVERYRNTGRVSIQPAPTGF